MVVLFLIMMLYVVGFGLSGLSVEGMFRSHPILMLILNSFSGLAFFLFLGLNSVCPKCGKILTLPIFSWSKTARHILEKKVSQMRLHFCEII